MSTILVPVDGSNHAMKALHIACDLASKYGGRVVLLHVLSEKMNAADLLALDVSDHFDSRLKGILEKANEIDLGPAPEEVLKMAGDAILEQAEMKVKRLGIEVEVLPMVSGNPASVILDTQKHVDAGTIVMGARGRPASSTSSSFGSVSQEVFNRALCTCLSVK